MTISKTLELILKRLDAIEAEQTETKEKVAELVSDIGGLERQIEEIGDFDEAAYLLGEVVEDARRKERLEWLAGARGAMGKAS